MIEAPELCPECGEGHVVPTARAGRTRRRKAGGRMPIPATLPIPTCNNAACATEWLDDATIELLVALDRPTGVVVSRLPLRSGRVGIRPSGTGVVVVGSAHVSAAARETTTYSFSQRAPISQRSRVAAQVPS